MSSSSNDKLNISLEEHLVDTLRTLQPLLPKDLAEKMVPYLSPSPPSVIPYSLLSSLSRWTRSEAGQDVLRAHVPRLDPHSYSMVSLLAGTMTSPDRFLGKYVPPKDPAEMEADRNRERKAITALLNALLSIVGSAAAAYWAAERTGWRIEWRVLLSLFVAAIVATSEGALFLIWQSRRASAATRKMQILETAKHKKDNNVESTEDIALFEQDGAMSTSTSIQVSELRHRK